MIFDHYESVFRADGPEDVPRKPAATGSGEPISDSHPRCGLCGDPMPAGEEMFKYHGYSGPCPKPPLKPTPPASQPVTLEKAVALLEHGILAMTGRARVAWADEVREFLALLRAAEQR